PRQTGQVCVLAGSPKESSQLQNIFVAVASCTCISSPMTGSKPPSRASPAFVVPLACASSDTGRRGVEGDRPLERVRSVEQPVLAEGGAGQLQADGKPLAEAAGNRDRRDSRQRHGHGAV